MNDIMAKNGFKGALGIALLAVVFLGYLWHPFLTTVIILVGGLAVVAMNSRKIITVVAASKWGGNRYVKALSIASTVLEHMKAKPGSIQPQPQPQTQPSAEKSRQAMRSVPLLLLVAAVAAIAFMLLSDRKVAPATDSSLASANPPSGSPALDSRPSALSTQDSRSPLPATTQNSQQPLPARPLTNEAPTGSGGIVVVVPQVSQQPAGYMPAAPAPAPAPTIGQSSNSQMKPKGPGSPPVFTRPGPKMPTVVGRKPAIPQKKKGIRG
jgi:hypothetical protein